MLLHSAVLAVLACQAAAASDGEGSKKEPPPKPCTIRSSTSGNFFDLNQLYIEPPKKDAKQTKSPAAVESWHSRGYDYGANFTMNICGPVVEELDDVVGLTSSQRKNVSAYYTKGKETYSMG